MKGPYRKPGEIQKPPKPKSQWLANNVPWIFAAIVMGSGIIYAAIGQ